MLNFDTIQKLKEKRFSDRHEWGKDPKGIDYEVYADEVPINDESAKLLIDLKPSFVDFASCILGENNALKVAIADKYEELLLDTRNETSRTLNTVKPQTPASFFLRLDEYLNRLGADCAYDDIIDNVFMYTFVEYYKDKITKSINKSNSQEL